MFSGYGGLSLSIEGPSKADIECHDNEDGSCRVTYKPTEPGNYIINVKFADEHVPGKQRDAENCRGRIGIESRYNRRIKQITREMRENPTKISGRNSLRVSSLG